MNRSASRATVVLLLVALLMLTGCQPNEGAADEATATLTATSEAGDTLSNPTSEPAEGPTRGFALGFTDFPHALSLDALVAAQDIIAKDADLYAAHFDGGVPWPEALAGAPFAEDFEREIAGKAQIVPKSHLVYLAVTPISFNRDGLAGYRGAMADRPLPEAWRGRSFDNPDVIAAYAAYVERMIDVFDPDYVAYAIEANMLADNSPEDWPSFLVLAEAVYSDLKAAHPSLPVFVTIQAEWFHDDPTAQAAAIRDLLPYTDLIAVSSYPLMSQIVQTGAGGAGQTAALVAALPADYFSAIAALAPDLPFAISETGWPAEPIGDPYPVVIAGSAEAQRAYLERLLADADALEAEFVSWFFTRDFDEQWAQGLSQLEIAPTVRLWKDNGLYDGAGAPRPALDVWLEALARPRR